MDADNWHRIETIFAAVAGLEGAELEQELSRLCANDATLKGEVKALVAAAPTAQLRFARLAASSSAPFPDAEQLLHGAGARIGAYRLIRQIGRGGMGVVYLAERADKHFTKRVALKVLPLGLGTVEARRRFQREREILAALEHPNIARLLDGGVTGEGTPYYVMEYVDGQALDAYCSSEALSMDQCLALFQQISQAVAYAHRNLVIHRDIKPDNILVGADGRPKLLDFGVAKLLVTDPAGEATVTHAEQRLLSPAFAAPELVLGEPATTACDIYSLGAVLYCLLTGRRPHDFESSPERRYLDVIVNTNPPLPSTVAKHPKRAKALRGDLDRIVAMAMRKEPERRYPSVDAFAADLDRHAVNLPVRARPDSVRYQSGKFIRRHRLGLAATALVMFALAGGLTAALWQAQVAGNARDEAEQVNSFLRRILASPRPTNSGRNVRIAEVLDLAAERLQRDFRETSAVRANLAATLGSTFKAIGQPERGIEWLQRARADYRALQGDNSRAGLSATVRLVNSLRDAGRGEEALALLEQASARSGALPPGDELHVALLRARFHALQARDPDASLAALDRAVALAPTTRWEDPRNQGALECDRLNAASRRGDFELLERLARDLLAWSLELNGPRHATTFCAAGGLAEALNRQGRFGESQVVLERFVRIAEDWLGAHDRYVFVLRTALGVALDSGGRFAESIAVHQELVGMLDEVPGLRAADRVTAMSNLAAASLNLGDLDRAETMMLRALAEAENELSANDWQVCILKTNLAELRIFDNRPASAVNLAASAVSCFTNALGPEHPMVLFARATEGGALSGRGFYQQALERLEGLPEKLAAIFGEVDPNVANVRAWLGETLIGLGRPEEARAYLQAAYNVRLEQLGADDPRTRELAELLAP